MLRALYESPCKNTLDIVAINELADAQTIAHLTRYDSTHGRFAGDVKLQAETLTVEGRPIHITHQHDHAKLPWREHNVDLVLECSGSFSDRAGAEKHLQSGAKKVLFSQPAEPDVDATVVCGINEKSLTDADTIISNASCTTNCVVPVIHCLDEALGVKMGHISTVHSAMNDQPVIDAFHHTDLRRTRSASISIIPVETALAKGIGRILPALAGKFSATALRVPTVNVSIIELTILVSKETTAAEVNRILLQASQTKLSGIMGFTDELLASCDFNHDPRSAIVDGGQTCVTEGHLVKVMAWFDNEWGFANRMLDVATVIKNVSSR